MKNMYFKLQLKRGMKLYPTILCITLLTLFSIALTAFVLLRQSSSGEERRSVTVAIVGNTDEAYFDVILDAVREVDSSKFFVSFPEMEEDEAKAALAAREIDGYLYIPKNFVKGVYYGKNIPAEYVTLKKPSGFGSALMNEVVDLLSGVVVETQNGMYSMQLIAEEYGESRKMEASIDELSISYMSFVLNRGKMYSLKIMGISDLLPIEGYYICGMLIFFLLLWGISCTKLLSGRNMSLVRLLDASGIGVGEQVRAEYAVYLIMTVVTLLLLALGFGTVVAHNSFGIEMLSSTTPASAAAYILMLIPAIIMITAMHKAFYECVSGVVSGILIQFLIAIGMGYISGCFYPNTFFPETVQRIAELLPVGAAFSYARKIMSGTLSIKDFALPIAYTILFAYISVFARKRRMAGDEK